MFSGIIEDQSRVAKIEQREQALKLLLERPFIFSDVSEGDSISVNGTCLTVETVTPEILEFTIGPETLRLTTWGAAGEPGEVVNVERSLRVGDRIHGHVVMGHADGTARVEDVSPAGDSRIVKVAIPRFLMPYVWSKGSLAVNGVSLTVNQVKDELIELCIIPETLRRTNLSRLKAGDLVNVEVDCMARALVHSRQFSARDLDFE